MTISRLRCATSRRAAPDGMRLSLHHLLAAAGSSPRLRPPRHCASPNATANGVARSRRALGCHRRRRQGGRAAGTARPQSGREEAGLRPFPRDARSSGRSAAPPGTAFARFDGSLSGPEKDAAIEAFRDNVPVLLCTESGGEGRNLQFCNTLINFDIPWNPMAIEQRIGRIDRIGQPREVFVFNLVTRGTIEDQVLRLLDEKISMFELVVGEVGAILGEIEEQQDFSDMVLDAWLETTEAGRAEAFDALGKRLDDARSQHEGAKALDEALFGEDFETA